MINGLEMVFRYLIVTGITHGYIITVVRTALDRLIVGNTESITTSTERYLVIKRILFAFGKKFATIGNRRRYDGYKRTEKCSQH